jgi:hypothetical protein
MKLSKGVYASKIAGKILIIHSVKIYEDLRHSFAICKLENDQGLFDRVLIRETAVKYLTRIGSL